MDTALLFEHLVSNYVVNCYNWGSAWYNGCLSETNTYANGVKVGRVYSLLQLSIDKLLSTLPQEKQDIINKQWEKISSIPTIDELDEFLSQLYQMGVLS